MSEKVTKQEEKKINLIMVDVPAESYVNEKGQFCVKRTQIKCDCKYVAQFIEIPPLAYDEKTGEMINKSLVPILKEIEPKNFYDEIQSYKGDCDIYSVLAKFQKTGDINLLNATTKQFIDIYEVPDNINDFNKLVKKAKEDLKKFSKEQQDDILNGDNEKVNVLIQNLVKKEMIRQGLMKEENQGNQEEVK